jgi:flagellar export protein FliJ
MSFHFRLQAILHFRQSIEHQQELRLRAANQQVARVRHMVEQIDARRQELAAEQGRGLSLGVTAAELRFGMQCDVELVRHKKELLQQLQRFQQLRDQQREILRQARKARETLEGVRDQQLRLFEQEATRREQRNQDDLFLLRREYSRRG